MADFDELTEDDWSELEDVKAVRPVTGDVLEVWQRDDGSVAAAIAPDVTVEAWGNLLSERIVVIAIKLAGGDQDRAKEIMMQLIAMASGMELQDAMKTASAIVSQK